MSSRALKEHTSVALLAEGVLNGNRLMLSRAISHVENQETDASALLTALYPHAGKAHIVGVTGAPGTGKSTLVTALALSCRGAGMTVGIVAIDPTSPFTGGALLGDRVRMRALAGDTGVFVRSMATRGSLGGLSKTTGDVVTVLDAAGFDCIIVETVGVGQAEVEIASTAHTTLVVEAPGLGDEVQAIKAGILEIADILVVNKADRPGMDRTLRALEMMLDIEGNGARYVRHHGQLLRVESPAESEDEETRWKVTVMKTVATDGTGVEDLRQRIDAHRHWLRESGEMAMREQLRIANTLENIIRAELNRRIAASIPAGGLEKMVEKIRRRESDPYAAAAVLLAGV
ncbi:methylmalonyl Co-A mutase-associated GTPase MeaB [Caldilinea sp.]|uniref:methylmalonyl Co-A mutase-associated GTPase MeaB n=1 Tax=Caldilinea sp. TaxID=2293560 RepID=UPI002B803ECE|nr:methylmalonyl Co-A mutase-associated GTPase MeaB [Caldilinea sp.]HRA68463.1 methylmalonyl Co-A mutase-associated GTPase MeaB [Caldilinea sp.]